MRKLRHPQSQSLDLSAVLYALSDPARLHIVKTLAASKKEMPCRSFKCNLAKPTMSHHFKVLREVGITKTRVQGTQHFISLCVKELARAFPGLLRAILKAAK